MPYCSLQHQTLLPSRHIHNWVLFLLWLFLFILSGVISPLFFSSILGTYQPGEFIFQCHIFLPFHTVNGVLKARILSGLPFVIYWIIDYHASLPPCNRVLHSSSCPMFLPFDTVHGVLKARILKWFAIPFSSGPILSDLSTMACLSWVAPHGIA